MKQIRVHKLCSIQVVCAILLSALFFGYLCPCHEYSDYGTGNIILGHDTCDDSPFLQVEAGKPTIVPVGFYYTHRIGAAILRTFIDPIFHPPQT
jgi:hypothetical protein